ncbi:unnamed protein product [Lathyrus oleraceus]
MKFDWAFSSGERLIELRCVLEKVNSAKKNGESSPRYAASGLELGEFRWLVRSYAGSVMKFDWAFSSGERLIELRCVLEKVNSAKKNGESSPRYAASGLELGEFRWLVRSYAGSVMVSVRSEVEEDDEWFVIESGGGEEW